MKRFVTYLYECKRGNKIRNVGFVRVNVREDKTMMEIYMRNLGQTEDGGKVYVLIWKESLQGLRLGEVEIENGKSDCRIEVENGQMEQSGYTLQDIEGIGIRLDSGLYIASCWKDAYAEEIVHDNFAVEEDATDTTVLQPMMYQEEAMTEEPLEEKEVVPNHYPMVSYEKIDLSQIRDLPSPNWHLTTNSFLVHGFWNYGYLVLKKNMEKDKETISLGVPGIYERPEAIMAVLFGFPGFEEIPSETLEGKKEKNQETKEGTFGCWFVELKM